MSYCRVRCYFSAKPRQNRLGRRIMIATTEYINTTDNHIPILNIYDGAPTYRAGNECLDYHRSLNVSVNQSDFFS